jgi:hypothetical protein
MKPPHMMRHVRSHRIFFFSARRTPSIFCFPIGKPAPHRSLMRDPPFFTYRRIETRGFTSSLPITGVSNPRDPMVSQRWLSLTLSRLLLSRFRYLWYRALWFADSRSPMQRDSDAHVSCLFNSLSLLSGFWNSRDRKFWCRWIRDLPFPDPRYGTPPVLH